MEGQVKYIYQYYYGWWGKRKITYHKVEKASLNFAKTSMRYYIKDYGYVYIPLNKTYTEDWFGEINVEGFTTDYNETHPHNDYENWYH